MGIAYRQFLAGKAVAASPIGLNEVPWLSEALAPFQSDVVDFALRAGRAAMFLDTGLGKTRCQIEWARQLPGKTLILAPLAVAAQTVREGARAMDIEIHHSRDGSVGEKITIANYERLSLFDSVHFDAVVLDESSILKSFMGKTKQALCNRFQDTRFKLACTATPAPNDYMELGNHSEFLGVMENTEMLTRWFIHDSNNTGVWKMKGHAERPFWQWVASWAACVSKPSDLGYEDGDYQLPQLSTALHTVEADFDSTPPEGMLFDVPTVSATTLHKEKKRSIEHRVRKVVEIVESECEHFLIWCETNEESEALARAIPCAVQVRGDHSPEYKEAASEWFCGIETADLKLIGKLNKRSDIWKKRILISKPSMFGYGLNFQHCARQVFASISFSYEQFYQAARRSWRFGQKRPVRLDVILSPSEVPVWRTVQRKLEAHERMKTAMRFAVFNHNHDLLIKQIYHPTFNATLPKWITA